MDTVMIVILISVFAIGFIFGCCVVIGVMAGGFSGFLRMDNSDGDGPYLFLELEKPPKEILSRKFVIFKVNPNCYTSTQK